MPTRVELAGGRWVKGTGDGLLTTFDAPSLAARTACALRERLRDELGLDIRAGLHTEEIELRGDDIGGLAVHVASRVQRAAGPSEVIASSTVRDLAAGSGVEFSDRGAHELKGVSGTHRLFDGRVLTETLLLPRERGTFPTLGRLLLRTTGDTERSTLARSRPSNRFALKAGAAPALIGPAESVACTRDCSRLFRRARAP